MTTAYKTFTSNLRSTPQSQPIFGSDQVPNSAGGYSYKVDKWQQLDRFLIQGSESGTYYIGEQKLTKDNAKNVLECIKEDGIRTILTAMDVSEHNRAPKNDPALFVLALASSFGDNLTRANALLNLAEVARTGTHLMTFAEYVDGMRGWGRALRNGIANWYLGMPLDKLEYQLVKYQSRGKWSNRDLLRLSHPKTSDPARNAMFKWVVDGAVDELVGWNFPLIDAFEVLKLDADPELAVRFIQESGLPREALPTILLNDVKVWEALLEHMPMTAMLRNLGNMSKAGLLTPFSASANLVVSKLLDADYVRKSRVHPLTIYTAAKQYVAGKGFRGHGQWEANNQVVSALDKAFVDSYGNVETTGKNILIGVDVSGSMCGTAVNGTPNLTADEAAILQATVFANTEPNIACVLFDVHVKPVMLSKGMTVPSVRQLCGSFGGGGTDCSLPVAYALQNKLPVDTFIILTDSETWAGEVHPKQLFDKFRKEVNPKAKMVVVSACANSFGIADPKDAGVLQVVGLDTTVPQVVSHFMTH